jgi:hypothetical protein
MKITMDSELIKRVKYFGEGYKQGRKTWWWFSLITFALGVQVGMLIVVIQRIAK